MEKKGREGEVGGGDGAGAPGPSTGKRPDQYLSLSQRLRQLTKKGPWSSGGSGGEGGDTPPERETLATLGTCAGESGDRLLGREHTYLT